jgi:hypothetical protein
MPEQRIVWMERLKIEDRTTRFFVRPPRRRGQWKWFDVEEVPPFEEEAAWVLIERKKPRGWRVVGPTATPR